MSTLRFENEYTPDPPMTVNRYPDGYATFQIDGTEAPAPISLSPSQISDLVAFLTRNPRKATL